MQGAQKCKAQRKTATSKENQFFAERNAHFAGLDESIHRRMRISDLLLVKRGDVLAQPYQRASRFP